MMKNTIIILSIFIVILSSCNSDKKEIASINFSQKNQTTVIEEPEDNLTTIYSFYKKAPQTLAEIEENRIIDYLAAQELSAKRTSRGIYYRILEKGVGTAISWGDQLKVDYKGYTLQGEEFDSSYERGRPISFKVGNMIEGWNYTLTYLHKGDKAVLYIPSKYGYGEEGIKGVISSNEILVFEIEIKN